MTTLEIISAPGFNISDYEPLSTDSPQQLADKAAFIQSVADLHGSDELSHALPAVACIVECVVIYLECCGGNGNNSTCWYLFQGCMGNCGTV